MLPVPSLDGLSWTKIRALARDFAISAELDDVVEIAVARLAASDVADRQFAVYVLGFTSGQRPENLMLLRQQAVPDPSWEVQEAVAQAFDAYCSAIGYDAALPTIDAWLVDSHPNARRAVTEGLRPWVS